MWQLASDLEPGLTKLQNNLTESMKWLGSRLFSGSTSQRDPLEALCRQSFDALDKNVRVPWASIAFLEPCEGDERGAAGAVRCAQGGDEEETTGESKHSSNRSEQ